jgi:hypothetical protein
MSYRFLYNYSNKNIWPDKIKNKGEIFMNSIMYDSSTNVTAQDYWSNQNSDIKKAINEGKNYDSSTSTAVKTAVKLGTGLVGGPAGLASAVGSMVIDGIIDKTFED